jgi:hypothetical protein
MGPTGLKPIYYSILFYSILFYSMLIYSLSKWEIKSWNLISPLQGTRLVYNELCPPDRLPSFSPARLPGNLRQTSIFKATAIAKQRFPHKVSTHKRITCGFQNFLCKWSDYKIMHAASRSHMKSRKWEYLRNVTNILIFKMRPCTASIRGWNLATFQISELPFQQRLINIRHDLLYKA